MSEYINHISLSSGTCMKKILPSFEPLQYLMMQMHISEATRLTGEGSSFFDGTKLFISIFDDEYIVKLMDGSDVLITMAGSKKENATELWEMLHDKDNPSIITSFEEMPETPFVADRLDKITDKTRKYASWIHNFSGNLGWMILYPEIVKAHVMHEQ